MSFYLKKLLFRNLINYLFIPEVYFKFILNRILFEMVVKINKKHAGI